jgi:hypothetical protein
VASIGRVVHGTGRTSWLARWRDPTGAQRSKNFPRSVDAERFLVTVEARDESCLRSLVLPTFADMPIGKIGLFDVQEWVGDLDADGTPQSPSARPTSCSDEFSTTPSPAGSSPPARAATSPSPGSKTPRNGSSPPKRSPT